MMNPYFLTILVYVVLAIFQAFDIALINYNLFPVMNGVRWLRVHFITLGIVTQAVFAVLPWLVAARTRQAQPKFRWDIWLLLNAGIPVLLLGMPILNIYVIFAGGTLIFAAATLLTVQLSQMRGGAARASAEGGDPHLGRKFYVTGVAYFLVGIIIGTGIYLGWSNLLGIKSPIEAHIHANNWGLMSLVFAGWMVDLYPKFTGRSLAWPRSVTPIYWMMTIGALGLILGPWTGLLAFTIPGLVLHLSATFWLVANMVKPLLGDRRAWTPGIWQLVTAYVWIIVPIMMAPMIILKVPGFPTVTIEQNAPQALIYGWVLQFGMAIVPYFFRLYFKPDEARLGGSWFSLVTVHLGGVFLWVSIFVPGAFGVLQGVAYTFWVLALIPLGVELWRVVQGQGEEGVPVLNV
ncbi:MAG: hypothetical protein H6636_09310 [Anaerolineales bacterium]|nr:hypothetical protein [Anaerolineales bacterium]